MWLPPSPRHHFLSHPTLHLTKPCQAQGSDVTKALKESHGDTDRNCLRPVKGGCFDCLHIVVLQLKFRVRKRGMGVLSVFTGVDALRTRRCFAPGDGHSQGSGWERVTLPTGRHFSGRYGRRWPRLTLLNISSPKSTSSLPSCVCVSLKCNS